MNGADLIVMAAVAAAVLLAAAILRRTQKEGRGCCGWNCSGCGGCEKAAPPRKKRRTGA